MNAASDTHCDVAIRYEPYRLALGDITMLRPVWCIRTSLQAPLPTLL